MVRPAKVIAKAFRAGVQRIAHRALASAGGAPVGCGEELAAGPGRGCASGGRCVAAVPVSGPGQLVLDPRRSVGARRGGGTVRMRGPAPHRRRAVALPPAARVVQWALVPGINQSGSCFTAPRAPRSRSDRSHWPGGTNPGHTQTASTRPSFGVGSPWQLDSPGRGVAGDTVGAAGEFPTGVTVSAVPHPASSRALAIRARSFICRVPS